MKVLLSGYYGFGNLGDEALLSGLLQALQARGHMPCVLSQDPEKTEQLHGVAAVHRLRGVPAALWQHDALISGGGGLLQDKTSRRSLQYYLGIIRLARALGKTVIIYGQSIGPLSDTGKRMVARSLAGLPVAVRDEASQELLASLGIRSELVADAALLLEPPDAPKSVNDAPVLLIPRGGYPHITRALIALARELQKCGFPVAAMSFHPDEDDESLKTLQGAVPNVLVWRADTPDSALAMLAQARHVVSARLHGLILAAVTQVPMSGIVYDPKVAAFLRALELSQHEISADSIDVTTLLDEVLCTLKTRHVSPLKRETIERLGVLAEQGMSWLERHLTAGQALR